MLIEKKLKDFLSETASSSPAPGGGSASALAGALGTALSEMVINLTVGKKKYADVSAELADLLPRLAEARRRLQEAVDRDTRAFNLVMAAYGLPKETEDEKKARQTAIREAILKATEVPLDVMETCLKALEMALIVAQKGNKNSVSDAGASGLLLEAAIEGAALNVKINLPTHPDDHPYRTAAAKRLKEMAARKEELSRSLREAVAQNL